MAIDLTGGIDPAREYMFAERPENPEMRDSVSFWIFDDRGQVGLPRIGIEAVAANWESHNVQVNVAFPDGRVYRLRDEGTSWPVDGPDGKPTVLGGGPLAFTCVEPFDVWTMSFDGKAMRRRRPISSLAARTGRWSTCGSRWKRSSPCRRGCRARCRPMPRPHWRRPSRAT